MKLRFLGQAVLQGAGLVYATIKYEKKDINNVDSYMPESVTVQTGQTIKK